MIMLITKSIYIRKYYEYILKVSYIYLLLLIPFNMDGLYSNQLFWYNY